jgi:gluconokinase
MPANQGGRSAMDGAGTGGDRGQAPAVVVVMGVSGSGKTTVASLLAGRLGWEFEDADDFHPPANVAKMHAGIPLTDADRGPWLDAIAAWIDRVRAEGRHGVVTCSALKRAYRRVLVGDRPDVRLVYLKGERGLIGRRMAARQGHFMPTSLLDSQFGTLEEPGSDENPVVISVGGTPSAIVAEIAGALGVPMR